MKIRFQVDGRTFGVLIHGSVLPGTMLPTHDLKRQAAEHNSHKGQSLLPHELVVAKTTAVLFFFLACR